MKSETLNTKLNMNLIAIGFGIFWAVWAHYGFLWALVYTLFWPVWFGYRMAGFFLTH